MSDDILIIDGSGGEGGGQVLRTSLALSAMTGIPLEVENIRANRPKPGLARQHLAGLELMGRLCGARISGGQVGSATIEFVPGKIRHGEYKFDIGTAGSVTLLLQTVLPALASVQGCSIISLIGGTDVKWAPSIDYCTMVLFPLLERCGLECSIETGARGYYPKGGGSITAKINSPNRLKPLAIEPLAEPRVIRGRVNITDLPVKIAERVRDSALNALPENLRKLAHIEIEHRETGPSQGIGIVLAVSDGRTFLGSSSLGERGKPAVAVGQEAARNLVAEIDSKASVDMHASDQLLPYLAMAGGYFTAGELTGHAETNVGTVEKFFGDIIRVENGTLVRYSSERRM
ncbi:MAG: RNA 3'-terminal phosphate cyclase [Candidatus Thermoplasmatota archaeon]|nr:RNA 3'-terminal phosphate cyclase [Candidatus Thermoplasmatota archaeon]MBU4072307.1 RNA 3'-terminal phosphate cyclase [Candidatus Thermoplasmatota archaeon]MBU4143845.1 RNA 3'-terminal phosphate cyclase [Candidatus Thermoplasmatota archaeon]